MQRKSTEGQLQVNIWNIFICIYSSSLLHPPQHSKVWMFLLPSLYIHIYIYHSKPQTFGMTDFPIFPSTSKPVQNSQVSPALEIIVSEGVDQGCDPESKGWEHIEQWSFHPPKNKWQLVESQWPLAQYVRWIFLVLRFSVKVLGT